MHHCIRCERYFMVYDSLQLCTQEIDVCVLAVVCVESIRTRLMALYQLDDVLGSVVRETKSFSV